MQCQNHTKKQYRALHPGAKIMEPVLPATVLVFAYGTLRQGFANHHWLSRARFWGVAQTKQKYALYVGEFAYLLKNEPISRITGEVYEVDLATLAQLDALEEHPHVYQREQVPVILADGTEQAAWLYFYLQKIGQLIESGDYVQARKRSS